MGQYGNQPDFGTKALTTEPAGSADTLVSGKYLGNAALYVGTGGDLLVTLAYGEDDGSSAKGSTFFKNVPSGSFLPIIVDYVWIDGDEGSIITTAADIIALY
jgi:hypothetical protein